MAVGLTRDEVFGPVVMVAAGGVLVELIDHRCVALAPVSPAGARALLDGLAIRRLLDGFRGRPGANIDALIAAIVAVGAIGHHLGDMIHSLDLNPVIAHPHGCVAVDALVAKRG
jgi:acetate---CoA ligase (ADP-forming)